MFFCLVWHLFEKKDAALDDRMKDKAGTGFQDTTPCSQYQVMYSKTSPSSETLNWNIPGAYSETTQTGQNIPNWHSLNLDQGYNCVQQLSQIISLG